MSTMIMGLFQLTTGSAGKAMVEGELESMTAIHRHLPTSTPKPITCGTYASDPNIHFFLCEFVEMADKLPDIQSFTSNIAQLHKNATYPNGKYGFQVPIYLGRMVQYIIWSESWELIFTNYMKHSMARITEAQDSDQEFHDLFDTILQTVIPRLLRPLETGGRSIKPCLVHGDLYAGNDSVGAAALDPINYDAASLYAHNEWEIAHWALPRHKLGSEYLEAYFKELPASERVEYLDDQIALYILRWELKGLVIYPGDVRYKTK